MPIPIILSPPPAFDRSIVPAFQTNFNRIRDALLKSFGGDYQTGIYTANFAAVTSILVSVSFPVPFNTSSGPLMVVTPIDQPGGPDLDTHVTRTSNVLFILRVNSESGALTGSWNVRWVAFYP